MSYSIKKVISHDDDVNFIQILNNNLYDGDADKRVQWFYNQQSSIRFILIDDETGEAVGSKGYGLRKFRTPMGEKIGAIAVDLSVNKKHRKIKAIFALEEQTNKFILESDNIDFIYTIPNNKSILFFEKNKLFHSVGKFQRHVKLLSFDEVFKDKWYEKLLPVANFLWGVATSINLIGWKSDGYKYIGPDFVQANHIWDTYYSERVIGERSTSYLEWRYETNPDPRYKVFNVTTKGQTVFIVYVIIKNRAYCVDIIAPECDNIALIRAFAVFERMCKQEKYSMIVVQYLGCEREIKLLEHNLWYRKYKPAEKVLFVATEDEELLSHLLSVDNSFWFACDEDAI